jgi:site-specific recombinase XerC
MRSKNNPAGTDKFPATKIPQRQLEGLVRQFGAAMQHATGTTRHVYGKGLDQLLAFAKVNSFRFTPDDFDEFRRWLFDQKKLSRNTVNVYLTASRRFCEFLIEKRLLKKNPAWSVHGTAQEFRTLNVKLTEVAAAISSIDRSTVIGKRDFAFLSAIFECGPTISELITANVGDLRRFGNRARLQVQRPGIHSGIDSILLPVSVGEAVYNYLSTREPARAEEPLFGTIRGVKATKVRLSFRGARAAMQKRLNFGERRRIRLDSLRTYCVVRLMSRGKSSDEVRDLMRFRSNMPFRKIMYNTKAIAETK